MRASIAAIQTPKHIDNYASSERPAPGSLETRVLQCEKLGWKIWIEINTNNLISLDNFLLEIILNQLQQPYSSTQAEGNYICKCNSVKAAMNQKQAQSKIN